MYLVTCIVLCYFLISDLENIRTDFRLWNSRGLSPRICDGVTLSIHIKKDNELKLLPCCREVPALNVGMSSWRNRELHDVNTDIYVHLRLNQFWMYVPHLRPQNKKKKTSSNDCSLSLASNLRCCCWLLFRRGLPPPPADTPESDRRTNGTSHDALGAAMADVSQEGRCLSLPDRLNRPLIPGRK